MDYKLIFLKLPSQNIVLLKFLLESYEGLAILRTLNSKRGEVVIVALPDTIKEVKELLDSLKTNIEFRQIKEPSSFNKDWLLEEFFSNK